MSTSEKTFTQVKDILRKLERSIDEAREKRLHDDDDAQPSPRSTSSPGAPGAPGSPGRAQPMQPSPRQEPPRTPSSGWQV